jgi:hypothetical protein
MKTVVPRFKANARTPIRTITPKKVPPVSPKVGEVALVRKPAPREQPRPVPPTPPDPPNTQDRAPAPPKLVAARNNQEPLWSPYLILKRRKATTNPEFLRQQLLKVPELTLDPDGKASKKWLQEARKRWQAARRKSSRTNEREIVDDLALKVMAKRPDLTGLPVLQGKACRLETKAASELEKAATVIRALLAGIDPKDRRRRRISVSPPDAPTAANRLFQALGPRPQKSLATNHFSPESGGPPLPRTPEIRLNRQSSGTGAALYQLLMEEKKPLRWLLVETLARAKDKRASIALARRALFDLDPEVREVAVKALYRRPREEYCDTLIAGLTYPWAPVADHAAEALVALRMHEVIPRLQQLLREKNPFGPFVRKVGKKEVLFVREVVRVNHLKNCLLCHAPSFSRRDLVQGAVPSPDRRIPSTRSPVYYYRGSGIVRADVTYLRQDFSVRQPVAKPGKWPKVQRFDFLVRTRPLTPAELATHKKRGTGPQPPFEQREAVAFALRELNARKSSPLAPTSEKVLPKAVPKPRP